ncbi:type IV secretion system DNA-binding domain-containing protein [Metallibacterium sp.]|uniref:type IV secretion system DNA-binding domain-containing protein n=1 Tax=Metallibacterium sp. TaxID=2940281 RepID=UPI002606F8BB|nr:type IV secretion system DNA-binding domain-containing protein [Metallibacterium sp.]
MNAHKHYITVRGEEIILGALLGALAGLATLTPILLTASRLAPAGWLALLHMPRGSLVDRMLYVLAWAVPLAGAVGGGWYFGRQESEQHMRGARLYRDPEEAADVLAGIESARMSEAQRKDQVRGIVIGGVELSRRRETEHAVMTGLPGGGKTVGVIFPVLDQVLARGDRVIAHDSKGDITAARFDADTSVLLGPWDERAAIWDAGADFFSPALVDEFAASVCGADPKTAGQNLSFHIGAALLLRGLIKARMTAGESWTWTTLADDLALMPRDLIQRAAKGDALVSKACPTAFSADPNAELGRGEQAMLSILSTSAAFIMQFAAVQRAQGSGARLFSLRRWLLGEADTQTSLVILNNNAQYAKVAKAIFGAMLTVISALASSASMPEKSADAAGLWLILDEARQLGPAGLEAANTVAEVGRSRGVRVLLGLQDAEQLAAEVGRDVAAPMLSMQGLRLYLRAAPGAAENLVRTVGEREIQRIQSTAQAGAVQGKTATYDRVPVCNPADFCGLGVRADGEYLDVELIAQADDVLCRLVQRVDPRNYRPRCPALMPSQAWSHGALIALQPQHDAAAEPVLAPERDADTETPAPENADDFSDLLGSDSGPRADPDNSGLDLE